MWKISFHTSSVGSLICWLVVVIQWLVHALDGALGSMAEVFFSEDGIQFLVGQWIVMVCHEFFAVILIPQWFSD